MRLLSRDSLTGLETYHDHDEATDTTKIIYVGNSDPVLEDNKRLANDNEFSKQGMKNEFWKYASIPVGVQMKFLIDFGIDVYNRDHTKALLKKLNDPEWRYLKCTSGTHR